MFQLDDNFLVNLGLGAMPSNERVAFLEFTNQQLKLRVGTELSKSLSNEHLDYFEKLFDSGDPAAVSQWMAQYCPNYEQIVAQEFEKIKEDIILVRDRLLTSDAAQERA